MAAPAWRVEFDRAAARELRKLGVEAERRVLRYLRERIAGSSDPRRFGHALTGDRKGLWRYRIGDYRREYSVSPDDRRFVFHRLLNTRQPDRLVVIENVTRAAPAGAR